MYTAVGQEPLVFLPGSLTPRDPRRPPPLLKLKPDGAPCAGGAECAGGLCRSGICRTGVVLKAPSSPRESTPAPVPALVVTEDPGDLEPGETRSSMMPVYIAAGGAVLIGAIWLMRRK